MMLPSDFLFIANIDEQGAAFPGMLRAALDGGCRWVMIRGINTKPTLMLSAALHAKNLCRDYEAKLFVSRDAKLARHINADGLHMPANTSAARFRFKGMLLGQSCHNEAELVNATQSGVDYISISPVFQSISKKDYPGIGLHLFRALAAKADMPVVALGGITPQNAASCIQQGADAVAVMGGLSTAQNPQRQTEAYVSSLKTLAFADARR